MEMIPIAGGALAVLGLTMMAIGGLMIARGGRKQVKVVIPTSTTGRAPLKPPAARPETGPSRPSIPQPPPPPPAPKPEPAVATPFQSVPVMPPPSPEAPLEQSDSTAPTRPGDEQVPDPEPADEETSVSTLPSGDTAPPAQPPPPPAAESTMEPTAPEPMPEGDEEPRSTMAISPGDMKDFRIVVEHGAPKSYGSLVGLSGGIEGREVRIDEEGFVIGRDQRTAQLVVSDPRISKRHVWIGVREGKVWAIDVGSTNGCYLNERRTERITEVVLKDGDILILSDNAASFEYRG